MNLPASTEKFLHKLLGNELDFDLKNYLIKGSFHSILIQIFSLGINFFTGILLARILGAEGYGSFTYIFTLLSVICTITVFGMDDLLVREISSFQSQSNVSGISSILKWAIIRSLIFSIFISIIFLLILIPADSVWLPDKSIYYIAIAGIPVFTLVMLLQAARRGMHRVISGQLPEKIIRPLLLILGISIIFFIGNNPLSAQWAISINVIAIFVSLIILIFQLRGFVLKPNDVYIPLLKKSKESVSSFYFFIATIMAVINVRADILMLGWMKSDAEVGIFNVAARFSDFTAFALLVITPIIAPSISRLFSLNSIEKLQQLVSKTAKANFIFSVLLSIFLFISGKWVLKIFGEEFSAGYLCMLLLCGGQLITTFFGPAGNILLMTGYEKLAFYSGLAGTIINIGLNFLLIPKYGIDGAATSTAISLFVWNGLQSYFVFKKLKINPTVIKF